MGKNATYKRRLRRNQKLKKKRKAWVKKLTLNDSCPTEAQDESNTKFEAGHPTNIELHEGRSNTDIPGSGTSIEFPESRSNIELPSELPRNPEIKENSELRKELRMASKHIEYYRNKIKRQEEIIDVMEEGCVERIRSVRHFWKDKIYKEGTRAGKILKRAMQNS